MVRLFFAVAALVVVSAPLPAQDREALTREYESRIARADRDSASVEDLVRAAEAERFLRDFGEAHAYLDFAERVAATPEEDNRILNERLWLELGSDHGIEAMQAEFARARERSPMPATVLAGWVNRFPELLIGGQYDDTIERLSADADDRDFRCACYAPKAWMHRVAGRMDVSRMYWDSLVTAWHDMPTFSDAFDEADWRAQYARNLARAGRHEESRNQLNQAIAADVSAFESTSIRRRRAQTYVELGEVDQAIADLEFLLSLPSPVSVHTLRNRITWEPIRDTPAFQALLNRHR